jgi:hypothetical protein
LTINAGLNARGPAPVPDVLADIDPDPDAVIEVNGKLRPRPEVSEFIEDTVIRQEDLMVHIYDPAVGDQRCRVVYFSISPGIHEANKSRYTRNKAAQPSYFRKVVRDKLRLQDEIFRRVAGQCKLREHRKVRLTPFGPSNDFDYPFSVSGEIAHSGIHLREGEPQKCHLQDPFNIRK